MAFNITATLDAMASKLQASGYFQEVKIGEPKAPPNAPIAAAIYMSRVGVAQLTLGTTIESHVVIVRIYTNMLEEPTAKIETDLAIVASDFMADLAGEFDLGGSVRNVDVGGQHSGGLSAEWGYIDLSGKWYRVVDVTVPLIVDDSGTLVI